MSAWKLSEIHHFYIELFAVILGSILAFYYIARAHTLNDNFSRFVGFGFLVSALIDLLHVVISFAFMDNVSFLKYFIPQTWFAGRIFLSAMLVMAMAKYPTFSAEENNRSDTISGPRTRTRIIKEDKYKEEQEERKSDLEYSNTFTADDDRSDRTFAVYLAALSVLAGSVAISSLYLVLPFLVIDNILLHRPYEIPSLVLFIIALILFYKNQLYKKTDIFYKGILAYLIIDIYAQIIMSYSANSFDTPHNVAHVLKDAGYFVNIIALALSSIQYNVRLRDSNKSLAEINVRLKEREEVIHIQYEKLKESEKMKDEFINIAAHELRTPIQPILGLTDIIRSRILTLDDKSGSYSGDMRSEQLLSLLDILTRNAKRLKRLTDNVLDITRFESHAFKLDKEQFDIGRLIEEALKEQNIRITNTIKAKTKIEILCMVNNNKVDDIATPTGATGSAPTSHVETATYDITVNKAVSNKEWINNNRKDIIEEDFIRRANTDTDSFLVQADRTKISRVVSNLLSNALTSIRLRNGTEEGRISIFIRKNEKQKVNDKVKIMKAMAEKGHDHNTGYEVIVNIKDNGQGINAEVLPNLFTKFVSGSDSGTGLGLYISKNIIEAHGGRIWASNNEAGDETMTNMSSGATFSFSLPLS